MKLINYILASILCCASSSFGATKAVLPYVPLRSQGLNTPRHLSGMIQQLYMDPVRNHVHGAVDATLFYNRSFDTDTLTECLFGIKECQAITISGSQVADRGADDWLADYFYLPTDYKSSVSFSPRIDNIGAEFSLYVGLDEWAPGLYFVVHAPLVHSRWDLNMCETIEVKGTNTHEPGYFTPDTLSRNDMLANFTQYAEGCSVGPFAQTVGNTDLTTTFENLRNARMTVDTLNQTRLADLRTLIGYNFVRKDRLRIGLQGIMAAPVGNRPEGEYLFDPVIGNGHHWELGLGVTANGALWRSEDQEKQIIFSLDAKATHLFASRQLRTFDLKGKPFSRYMLAQRMGSPVVGNLKGGGTSATAQFMQEFLPVANLTKLCVDVSSNVQAEITALFTFVCDNFSWDLGYNFWARSCENFTLRGPNPFDNNSKWALKGDSHVYGYDRGAAAAGPLVGPVALSATQKNATINSGLNFTADTTVAQGRLNPNIDLAQNATGDASGGSSDNTLSAQPDVADTPIKTSIQPVFLTSDAIDLCEVTARGMSSTLFTHFSYQWKERTSWIPFIGIGGQAEFNHSSSSNCDTDCSECVSCAISQWGIWLKGGMTF